MVHENDPTQQRCPDPAKLIGDLQDAGIATRTFDWQGTKLAVLHKPSTGKCPVLLLHGVMYSAASVFDLCVPGHPRAAYTIAHSVFVLFLRVERIRHIPTHILGIVLGALIAVILSSMPLSGAPIALAGTRFDVTILLFGAIALTCLSHLYFILSTRDAP